MRLRHLRKACIAASLLVALDALLWLAATRILAAQTTAWIGHAQAQGWTITTADRVAGGGPFLASLTVVRPGIAGGDHILPGGLTWSADRVVLSIGLFHPFTLQIAADGQQFLRLSHAPDLGFTAASEWVRLPLLPSQQRQAEFEAEQLSGGIEGSRHPQDVQVAGLSARLSQVASGDRPLPSQGWRLDIRAGGIQLPDIGYWPLGATVSTAQAALMLDLPHLPEPAHAAAQEDGRAAAEATAWRDGGGSLALRDANFVWGPLAMRGQADLRLDGQLQPAGSGTLDVAGTARALSAASGAGLISPGLATTASAVLMVMTHVALQEDGRQDADAVRLPFRLRDSTVSVGEIPVAQLPAILWGRGKPS